MFSITSTLGNLYFSPTFFTNLTCFHYPYFSFHNKFPKKISHLRFSVEKELVFGVGKKGISWGCGSGFVRKCKKDWASEGNLDLEEEILEFMKSSENPEAFPRKKDLIDAGRNDLVESILRRGGWLASGWDLDDSDCENDDDFDLGLLRDREGNDVVVQDEVLEGNCAGECEEVDSFRSNSSPNASSSGRTLGGAVKDYSGIEGILNRLEKERTINFGFGSSENGSGTGMHVETSEREHDRLAKNSNPVTVADRDRENKAPSVKSTHGAINESGNEFVNTRFISNVDKFRNSFKPDTWRAWSNQRAGFSDMEFEAGDISSSVTRTEGEMDNLRNGKMIKEEGVDASWNGSKESFHDGISHDQIRSRLRHLKSELSSVLHRLKSNTSESGPQKCDEYSSADYPRLSDAWEFKENEIMNARDKLRSVRAKLAVLEGKMALAVVDAHKMVEEKQKRIDYSRRALQLLRTVCIVWPNAATEVLLSGSFDGWTTQRKMEKSNTGIFSLYVKLYPGRYEIKFIVDGVWKVEPLRPIVNNDGYENNLLIIT